MKRCLKCGEYKPVEQFSKRTKSSDGLQQNCKSCNKITNQQFREKNPEHHANWQRENWSHFLEYYTRWRKGDKPGVVYALINPKNEAYVGMTNTHLSVRIMEHRTKYRRYKAGKISSNLPLLFESFDKYGVENHRLHILFEDQTIDRKALKQMETTFIKSFKQEGKSLNIKL